MKNLLLPLVVMLCACRIALAAETEGRDLFADTWVATDALGRNDLVTSKVAVDSRQVYFYAETSKPLTAHTGNNWMLLLLDADQNHQTGWYGYDYLVNRSIKDDKTTTLMRYAPESKTDPWIVVQQVAYRYNDKFLELGVPRSVIGLEGASFRFDFHWCDNPAELIDPISLCTHGDSAPNRQFNYRCIWKQ